ncbi:CDP-alcohol phosphatidyltransferase family protein [Tautonia marina]|uniref:CDP-alcohol phosphatidyltransferase family protein n=1 Tax=Tautonia marina TaxID=2653855 RepID=UPI0012608A27|nr:CDP-alcohol phosphatidyltransferase family protein [Tautonia marina]
MSRPSVTASLLLPNVLTFFRFGLAVVFPLVSPSWRPLILILAALSDAFDGMFSRLFHTASTFGQILDPIADKVFVGVVLITLLVEQTVSLPALLLVAARDLAVAFGVVVAVIRIGSDAIRRMPPHVLGKATTAFQFAFLLWVVYDQSVPFPLLLITGVISIAAGIDYLRNPHWKRPESAAHRAAPDDETADL